MSLIRRRIKGWAFALSLVFLAAAVWLPSVIAQPIPQPGGGGTSNPALNTSQTPDTYYLSTDPLGNTLIVGEAADSGFDFAHAQATDPTFIVHSHNQNTTQWVSLNHDGTNGIFNVGTGLLQIQMAGSAALNISRPAAVPTVSIPSAGNFNWNSDLYLTREAAATLQLGQDVNGAAVAQTFKAHDGITGTDIKGASLTLESGLGTGAAVSNPLTINRQIVKATGTTAQTYAPAQIVCPTKILSNTSATAQTIATITTTTLTAGGVTWFYNVTAASGTAVDADTGAINISWNNPAGTVAATAGTIINSVQSNSSGTLAATPTVTVATNVVSIKVTPTWATIVPTTVTGFATFIVNSATDTVVCQ